MKAEILLISVFGRIEENSNDRVNSVHDYFKSNVKIVTTDFSHRHKSHHSKQSFRNVDYIHVPGYKNNLSVKRLYSHWIFAIKLIRYLFHYGTNYDVWLCIVPTPSSAFAALLYKMITRTKTPIYIDVIDVWPEALVSNSTFSKSIILWPWKMISHFIYLKADRVYTATKKYRTFIKTITTNTSKTYYPLGIDVNRLDKLRKTSDYLITKGTNEIWIAYAGNFGSSYDFNQMIISMKECQNNLKETVRFILIGGGVQEESVLKKLKEYEIDFMCTGILPYKDYLKCLSFCDIGFNIYKPKSTVAQSYKFNDYVDSELFILNNLTGETADLINYYSIGRNIQSASELTPALIETIINWGSIKQSIKNQCRILISQRLDKKSIYASMEQDIISSLNSK